MAAAARLDEAGRVRTLLEEFETKAAALRLTLDLLDGAAALAKQNGHGPVLAAALELEKARRHHRKRPAGTVKRGRPPKASAPVQAEAPAAEEFVSERARRRRASAGILALFSRDEARTPAAAGASADQVRGLGALVRHGYLVKKKGGLVRSSIEFVP